MTTSTDWSVTVADLGPARKAVQPDEVVLGISPGFATEFDQTIIGLPHADVLRQLLAGAEEQQVTVRVIRVTHSSDLALIAHTAARLSGSGIGIGLLSRGTAMIHQRDLPKLSSLELFPQSPMLDLEVFRSIGSNAAQYAKGEAPEPVPTLNDHMARPRWQAKAALLQLKETELIVKGATPVEVEIGLHRAAV